MYLALHKRKLNVQVKQRTVENGKFLTNWIVLHLFNDDTCHSGHISRSAHVGFSHNCPTTKLPSLMIFSSCWDWFESRISSVVDCFNEEIEYKLNACKWVCLNLWISPTKCTSFTLLYWIFGRSYQESSLFQKLHHVLPNWHETYKTDYKSSFFLQRLSSR